MSKTYDPLQVSVILGSHIVTGFADGTFVSIERNNQTFELVSGASGETARAKSNDRSGTVTITLMQTSESNSVLSGFAAADELSNSGKFPIIVKDNNGDSLYEATEAWVQQPASVEFSKEISEREWVLETGELIMVTGGTPV